MMNPLQQIMGINEASQKWAKTPEEIAALCAEGLVQAVRLDGGNGPWVLLKDQPAPSSPGTSPSKKELRSSRPGSAKTSSMSSRLRDALLE